jgi:tRNA (adenine37-N6)-methyltransferase
LTQPTLTLEPIGIIRTPFRERYEAPRQPSMSETGVEGRVILNRGHNYEQALHDLEGFEKIWLVYWFDRNRNWKPKIQVPRGPRVKRGVFATRSPHRPNPIGLSLVDLISVRGLTLAVGNVDLLDKTPILDIKPYLPNIEAFPAARVGWLDEIATPQYEIVWSPLAEEQREWLSERDITFDVALEQLCRYPIEAHPYRRIKQISESESEIAIKSWRLQLTVGHEVVTIERIVSGYTFEVILQSEIGSLHDDDAHRTFVMKWPADTKK